MYVNREVFVMKLKKILSAVLALAAAAAGCTALSSCSSQKNGYKIGVCQLVEHDALDAATKGFTDYLTEKLGDQVTIDVKLAQGELTNCTTIVNGFVSSGVDLIMGNATNAVKAAREATDTIPVIGTSVTDYVSTGIVASDEKPGANVTGVSDNNPVAVQVKLMQTLCPDVKTVGIVFCSGEENSHIQAEEAKTAFEAQGFTVKLYTVADSNEIQSVVTKACSEVDAFYEPTDNLIASNVSAMSNVTTPAGKPVFTAEEGMCKAGFLATYSISYYEIGRRAGEMAYDILVNGKNPGDIPIYHFDTDSLNLVINEENAKELGIEIPAELAK